MTTLTFNHPLPVSPISDMTRDTPSAVPSQWTLMHVVQEVVQQIADEALTRVAAPTRGFAFQPRALLALMTYCYATGIYSSQDVEAALLEDSLLRFLCANELPHWHTLRRFRRYNREVLAHCLAETLRLGRSADDFIGRRDEQPPRSDTGSHRNGAGDYANADHATAEAATRIEEAIRLDSYALEG